MVPNKTVSMHSDIINSKTILKEEIMKKGYFSIVAAVLFCVGLLSCGGSNLPIDKYCDELEDIREIREDGLSSSSLSALEKANKKYNDRISELSKEIVGMELSTENEEEQYFTIIKPFTVKAVTPQYGGIDFHAVVKPVDVTVKISEFFLVACVDSEPVKLLPFKFKFNDDDSIDLTFFLNVGNIIEGGEKADKNLRKINRIVIAEDYSELVKKVQGN